MAELDENHFKFIHSSTVVISGATNSGKSELTCKILEQYRQVFAEPAPSNFVWFYQYKQPSLEERLPHVEFVSGVQNNVLEKCESLYDAAVVIDDLSAHISVDDLNKIFVILSHHRKLTIFYLVQNLYYKNHRHLSLNSHVNILTSTLRDYSSVRTLAQQLFGFKFKYVLEALTDTQKDRSFYYLIIRSRPGYTDSTKRVYRGIFKEEDLVVYELK